MLDIRQLRTDPQAVAANLARRGYALDLGAFTALETRRKEAQVAVDALRNERNTRSRAIGQAKAKGEDVAPLLAEVESLGGCVGTLGKVLGGATVLAAVVVLVGNTDILGVAGLLAVIFSLPVASVAAMGLLLWALALRGRRRGRLELRPSGLHIASEPPVEPIALEHPVGDGETQFGELLADPNIVPPDSHVNRTERMRELDRILATLTPREQLVIRMRFGIGQDQPRTLEQVGHQLSVTRERIRQIEAKALKKLKSPEVRDLLIAIR